MKRLKEYLLESRFRKHVDQTTVGDFAKWACLHEMPDGKPGKVEADDCIDLIDNGWFEMFDEGQEGAKECADFINKNWDENIKVTSLETPNDWEISFTLDDKEYVAAFVTYFGDLDADT